MTKIKKFCLVLIMAIVLAFGLCGCEDGYIPKSQDDSNSLFKLVYSQGAKDVLVDKETGVMYLSIAWGGITPLYNADGSLKVWREDNND